MTSITAPKRRSGYRHERLFGMDPTVAHGPVIARHVSRDEDERSWAGQGPRSRRALGQVLRRKDLVHPLPFPLPDVIAALPDAATRKALARRGKGFPGWERLVADYRSARGQSFKELFKRRINLQDLDIRAFLEEVLAEAEPRPLLGTHLHRAVEQALGILGPSFRYVERRRR